MLLKQGRACRVLENVEDDLSDLNEKAKRVNNFCNIYYQEVLRQLSFSYFVF